MPTEPLEQAQHGSKEEETRSTVATTQSLPSTRVTEPQKQAQHGSEGEETRSTTPTPTHSLPSTGVTEPQEQAQHGSEGEETRSTTPTPTHSLPSTGVTEPQEQAQHGSEGEETRSTTPTPTHSLPSTGVTEAQEQAQHGSEGEETRSTTPTPTHSLPSTGVIRPVVPPINEAQDQNEEHGERREGLEAMSAKQAERDFPARPNKLPPIKTEQVDVVHIQSDTWYHEDADVFYIVLKGSHPAVPKIDCPFLMQVERRTSTASGMYLLSFTKDRSESASALAYVIAKN